MIDPDYFYKTGYIATHAAFEYCKTNDDPMSCDLSIEYKEGVFDSVLLNAETGARARRVKEELNPTIFGLEFDNTGGPSEPGIFIDNPGDGQAVFNKFAEIMGCEAPTFPDCGQCVPLYLGMFPRRGNVFRVIMTGRFEHLVEWCVNNGIDASRMTEENVPLESDIGFDIVNGQICRVTYTVRLDWGKEFAIQSDPWFMAAKQRFLDHVDDLYGDTPIMIARDQVKIGLTPDFPEGFVKAYFFVQEKPKQFFFQRHH